MELRFHYQPVRTKIGGTEYYAIHEAFSDEQGLRSVCPDPVVLSEESLDELILLLTCVNTDLKRYKTKDYHELVAKMSKHPNSQDIDESLDNFFEDDFEYSERFAEDKIIDLVDYFK